MAIMESVVSHDPLQAERFAFGIKEACPQIFEVWKGLCAETRAIAPFPPHDTITAAQCTLFDNWVPYGGRKPKTINGKREKGARMERFKVSVECWTIAPSPPAKSGRPRPLKLTTNNAAFKGTAHLMEGEALKGKVDELSTGKAANGRPFGSRDSCDDSVDLWKAYGDLLLTAASDLEGLRLGPVFSIGAGTHWHLDTYAYAEDGALQTRKGLVVAFSTPHGNYGFTDWSTTYPDGRPLKGNAVLTSRVSDIPQKRSWTTTAK